MTQTYRMSLTLSFAAGYAVLAVLLFSFHDSPIGVALDLIPFFLVGAVGLGVVLFAPNREEPVQATTDMLRFSLFGCGQRLSVLQMAGLGGTGFFFGILLHKIIRLFA